MARARALHEGVANAVAAPNPPAAAALLRQFVETLAAIVYVTLNPKYAGAWIHTEQEQRARGGPTRKAPAKVVSWMERSGNAKGFEHIYKGVVRSYALRINGLGLPLPLRPSHR
ncbi:MAG: hypothetical protein ABWX92_02155 [Mycetocola sp.]